MTYFSIQSSRTFWVKIQGTNDILIPEHFGLLENGDQDSLDSMASIEASGVTAL